MSEGSDRPRLTIDTNYVIRALLYPGNASSRLLTKWGEENFQWVITFETFHELTVVLNREKFRVKYGFRKEKVRKLLEAIAEGAEFVTSMPLTALPIHSRDTKDDKFLVCAFSGKCRYLITGDEDLLVLNGRPELQGIQIITAEEYLKKAP